MKPLSQSACFDLFCERVTEISERFLFDGWDIECIHDVTNAEHAAECISNITARRLELRLKAKLPASYRNHDDIRRLATHEMCHALAAPAFGVDGVRYLTEREAYAAWEEVTIRLMRGVFGYKGAWRATV